MNLFSRDYWVTILAPRGPRRAGGAMRGAREPLSALCAKIALFVIIAWICIWWQAVIGEAQKAPPKWAMDSFTIVVKKDERAILGWRDLGQKPGGSSAEERHIAIQERSGGLWLYNVAHIRKVAMTLRKPAKKGEEAPPAFETLSERLVIPHGATSEVAVNGGKGKLTFSNVTDRTFDLQVESLIDKTKRAFRYDGSPNGLQNSDPNSWSTSCTKPEFPDDIVNKARLSALTFLESMETHMPPAAARLLGRAAETDIAVLGGDYDCVEPSRKQVGKIGQLPWRSLKIVRNGSVFMVAPYDAATRSRQLVSLSVKASKSANPRSFQEAGWQIDGGGALGGLTGVVLGKTSYATTFEHPSDGSIKMTFKPAENVMLFAAKDCASPDDRKLCPSKLDTGEVSLAATSPSGGEFCSSDKSRCWQWSLQRNSLATLQEKIAAKSETVAWRAIAATAALVIAGILAGGPLIAFQRLYPPLRKRAAFRPYRTLRPLVLTAISVAIALSPNLLNRWGVVVPPLLALQITLLNWLFAAVILLRGASGILLGFMWIAVTLMAALGSMNLAVMVVDGDTSRWIGFFVKQRIMFLDFVPPLVIAVASCPTTALRPVLQVFVAGSSGWSRLIRFVPAAMLALLFVGWYFVGRQTGFGVFQPVEAGKFAMVFLVATALMSLDPRFRTGSGWMAVWSWVSALLMVAVLTVLLVTVPLLRSDWSPALIMVLLFAGILAAFGTVVMLRSIGDQFDAHYQRQQVPRVFKPAFSWFWWTKQTWFHGLVLLCFAVIGAWFVLGSPIASTFARVTGVQAWKGDTQSQLLALENEGLGSSRRVVVERIISWLDLDFDRPEVTSCAFSDKPPDGNHEPVLGQHACYLDIEWQLIRSRRVIATAPCGLADYLRVGPGFGASATDAGDPVSGIARPFAALLGERSICNVEPPPKATNAENKSRKEVRPIDIPVVESDFAGSFLIGRLGAAAGLLLYGAQALLLIIVAIGFVRVSWMPSSGQLDEAVRRYIAIVLAGSAWLLLLQWSLSWSNMLGLLPVMGQPMTFLSYATSHHLFMAVPCILVFVVGLRYAGMPSYRYTPRDPPLSRYNPWSLW